jgi:hypothetical protein
MRRQLDLSSRQVATLDSIERSLLQRNRTVAERLQSRRDSLVGSRDLRALTRDEWETLRMRLDSLAPLRREMQRNDSTARAAALRVLTDSQRVRVREMRAERRGFAMGRMMDRGRRGGVGPGRDGFGPRRGFGPQDMGPRARMGPRGLRRPMEPRGFRDGFEPRRFRDGPPRGFRWDLGPPGVRDRMGPEEFGERLAPRRRMLPPEMSDSLVPDSVPPRRSERRPPEAEQR